MRYEDEKYYAYLHWVKMHNEGLMSGATFDLIIKDENYSLEKFFKPTDLCLKKGCEDRMKKTIAYETRMYDAFSRGEYAKFIKDEIKNLGKI